MTYSESQIREACREKNGMVRIFSPAREEELIRRLKDNDHAHDFTDTDTVTVKELRDAFYPKPQGLSLPYPQLRVILKRISENRGPQYKPGKVYRTATGIYVMRGGGSATPPSEETGWWRFGSDFKVAVTQTDWLPLEEMP